MRQIKKKINELNKKQVVAWISKLAITDTVISLLVFLLLTLVSKASSNKSNNGKKRNSWINKIASNQQNKMKGFEP